MEPVYLKRIISSDPEETSVAKDVNAPFAYLEWKQRRPNLIETHAKYHYGQYVLEWFEKNKATKLSKVFVLKQKYLYLLDQLQLFFTTEEKTEWYSKINLMDEKELLLAIPYFAKKLKTIALYYLNLRKKLKNTKLQYNMAGTSFGLEQQISNLLLGTFTDDNKELSPTLHMHVPSLSGLKQNLVVQVEELYDDTDYMDKSPNNSYNQFNVFHVATENYFNTKGISLSSGDWLFNCLTLDPAVKAETFISQLTGDLLEIPDEQLYTSCIEKYLAESKKILAFVPETEKLEEKQITIQSGSNRFYYPGTNIDPTISLESVIDPVVLGSLNLSGATAGTDLETADTMFVKNGQSIQGAWLKYEKHKKNDEMLLANLKQNDVTTFIFPYPGYGLSGEEFLWTGPDFKSTIGYNFLSNDFKMAVNEAYWNQTLDIDSCESVFINNTTLAEVGATSNKNPKFADEFTIRDISERDTTLPTSDRGSAWLYKFDQAVYPVSLNSTSRFLWPYQLISSEKDSYGRHLDTLEFSTVCSPVSIKDLITPYSISSNSVNNSDVIYKFSNYSDEFATECCWLSSSSLSANNRKMFNQKGFSAQFASGAVTRFVWTGPTQTLDNVFSSITHSADCPFITNVPELISLEPDKCTCKQVYYSPFGHPGTTLQSNNEFADFIALDTGAIEDFDKDSWRDPNGNPFADSPYVAWFKTNSKLGWGDGSWVSGSDSTQAPLVLETGKAYFYKRANSRTSSNTMPFYVVNHNFNYPASNLIKWVGAKLQEDEWVSTGLESNMVFYPGDFIQYKRANQTTNYYISSEQIEDQSKNVNTIWSTFDYIVSGTYQDTTYILWPTEEKPIAGSTLSQYPSASFFDLDVIFWWKIQHTLYPTLSTIVYSPTTVTRTTSAYSTGVGTLTTVQVTATSYTNKTIFSFTPPSTGTYTISVSAKDKKGNSFLFTDIPQLTVVPQYYEQELLVPLQHNSSGFLLEQPLYGWNYNINKPEGGEKGAKPYWAQRYTDKSNATKFKGIQSWGYPNDYIDGYLPNHAPKVSPLEITYGSIIDYNRVGYTLNWQQPITFNTFTATSTWCKLNHSIDSSSNLASLYDSKNSFNLTVFPTSEVSDIKLSNILNGFPVEVFYYALNSFTWTLSVKKTESEIAENIPRLAFESPAPWSNISNRFYPTIATIPTLAKVYSEKEKGGYSLPQNLGASLFINKDFETFLRDQTLIKDELVEDLNIHVGGQGRTTKAQPTIYDWTENNQWMKEPATAGGLAGGVKNELTKTLQTFVPYEESSEEVSLGLITPRSRMSPWGGSNREQWTDLANEPKGFTGIRNLSAWIEDQVLKTDEKSIEDWTSDIYGNQYGLLKNLQGVSVSQRKNVYGELWVRTNSQKVIPASTFLSKVYDKFKHKAFYTQLFGENIKTFECFLDTLIIETSSAVLFLPIDYDYETEEVSTSYDDAIIVEDLSQHKKYEGSWFFPKTKTLTAFFTVRDVFSSNFAPTLYNLSLDTRRFSKTFPNNSADESDVLEAFVDINIMSVSQTVFSYNSTEQSYLLTYLGNTANGGSPFIIDFKIEQQENLKITAIDRYVSSGSSSGPTSLLPVVDISSYGVIYGVALTPLSVPIIASNSPLSWTLIGGQPAGISLSNSGVLTGTVTTPGTYFINYQVSNSAGSVTYPLTLIIL